MKLQARQKGVSDVGRGQQRFDLARVASANKHDKGEENGSCNRTACQAPLADEPVHQFMARPFTSGQRLFYCERCAFDFDQWDHRSGDAVRITREEKA